ncbi:right-handed parallel beta-helix repeat-containing protein [Actinoallomurus soli]|uniref:right-handed parallel beta-helix repeat-containing protein n=1 Tax=Actinoallomurus soli TaxID=2952535 RepID=UPI0020932065|nr:right-handed parallel beta-helix repeat-containing protein [Actinoallomurus soli]MCO5968888.1 right-handed parallel beta-helix repeat-containing protein [Actinoallomurus soli]
MAAPDSGEAAPRRRGRRLVTTVLVLGLAAGGTYAYVRYTEKPSGLPAVDDVSPNDARQEAALVDQESQRIMQTNAVLTSTLRRGGPRAAAMRQPNIFGSSIGKTLVLPQRSRPYYVADLQKYAQRDFQQQNDGSYVLGVNVFVAAGAKLVLQSSAGPLTIRMKSVPGVFTSIVGFGASIRINGSAQNPVRIMSWNDQSGTTDTRLGDGRAYIRAIGGEFQMKYARVSGLGFWSGPTGGIAMTGSDRPDDAAERVDPGASAPKRVELADGTTDTTRGGQNEVEVTTSNGKTSVGFLVPAANLVTGSVDHSTIDGDAYGIFVSASDGTQITNNRIENSQVNGVLMHRFARNASIENTTVTGSRGDGFVLSRGTENVRITGCTAEGNGGNGFTLNGQPLANGPSASGESPRAYGDSSVTSSTARDNRRYGVELLGGAHLAVQTSKVVGGDMGIVASGDATGVQISGNELSRQARQGIVLRGGVTAANIAGNIVDDTDTAIYLRDSTGSVIGNTVQSASRHGVSLVGQVGGARVTGNTFGGAGTSALDVSRAKGTAAISNNGTTGWHDTAGFWTEVKRVAKPMNIIWTLVFLLVVVSALRSRGSGLRIGRRHVHPYDDQRKLEQRPVLALQRARKVDTTETSPDLLAVALPSGGADEQVRESL